MNRSAVTIELIKGRKTGFAIVQLGGRQECEWAFQELNGKKIGERWIKLDRADLLVEVQQAFEKTL